MQTSRRCRFFRQPAAFQLDWFWARNIIGTARESWPDNKAALERQTQKQIIVGLREVT